MNVTKTEATGFDADVLYGDSTFSTVRRTQSSIRSVWPSANSFNLDSHANTSFVLGLGGSGQALRAPKFFWITWTTVNALDTAPTVGVAFWRMRLNTSVVSQELGYLAAGAGANIVLSTTAAGLLKVRVNNTDYMASNPAAATLVVGQVYEIELAAEKVSGSSECKFIVTLDRQAVAGLTIGPVAYSGAGISRFVINNTSAGNLDIDDVVIKFGNGLLTAADMWTQDGRAPHLAYLHVVADGNYTAWTPYQGGVVAPSPGPDWTYIDEVVFDGYVGGPRTELRQPVNTKVKQSWKYGGFDVGDDFAEIHAVISRVFCNAGIQDHRFIETFWRSPEGVEVQHPEKDQVYTGGNDEQDWPEAPIVNHDAISELWLTCPFTGQPWTISDLAYGMVEHGVLAREYETPANASSTAYVGQAFLIVIWLEGNTVIEFGPELGAECDPCDEAKAARYLDAYVEHNGENADEELTVELELAPGADWVTPGLSHTLTTPDSLFSGDDVGRAFRLGDPDGDFVIVDVTTFGGIGSITVTNRTAVPESLRSVATSEWARMISTMPGLDHLEDETVYANCDGTHLGPFTVASGEIILRAHYAVICAGLKYDADLETLDVDFPNQGRPISAAQKLVGEVSVRCEKSREFYAGDPESDGGMALFSLLTPEERAATPTLLVSRKRTCRVPKKWEDAGRIFIRSSDSLPLTILSIEPDIALGGKGGG